MHNDADISSSVIKSARENAGITIEVLAAKIDVSERYIYRIENERKKPSYSVLLKLIQELAINSDLIFYPDKPCKDHIRFINFSNPPQYGKLKADGIRKGFNTRKFTEIEDTRHAGYVEHNLVDVLILVMGCVISEIPIKAYFKPHIKYD